MTEENFRRAQVLLNMRSRLIDFLTVFCKEEKFMVVSGEAKFTFGLPRDQEVHNAIITHAKAMIDDVTEKLKRL